MVNSDPPILPPSFPRLAIFDFAMFTFGFALLFAFHSAIASKTPTELVRHPDLLNHLGSVYAIQFGFAIASLATFLRHRRCNPIDMTAGIYLALICGVIAVLEMTAQVWAFQLSQLPSEVSGANYIQKLAVPFFSVLVLTYAIPRVPSAWKFAFGLLCIYFIVSAVQGFYFLYSTEEFMATILRYYPLVTFSSKMTTLMVACAILLAATVDVFWPLRITWMHHVGWLLMFNLIVIVPMLYWAIGRYMWPD